MRTTGWLLGLGFVCATAGSASAQLEPATMPATTPATTPATMPTAMPAEAATEAAAVASTMPAGLVESAVYRAWSGLGVGSRAQFRVTATGAASPLTEVIYRLESITPEAATLAVEIRGEFGPLGVTTATVNRMVPPRARYEFPRQRGDIPEGVAVLLAPDEPQPITTAGREWHATTLTGSLPGLDGPVVVLAHFAADAVGGFVRVSTTAKSQGKIVELTLELSEMERR